MKKIYGLLLFTGFILSCEMQENFKVIADLPKELKEVSGIAMSDEDSFWMINDSGNKSKIYEVDFSGKIISEFKVKAKNKDWEDLTQDELGNLYIGDFGNNDGKRTHFKILKIESHKLVSNQDNKIDPQQLKFYYPNNEPLDAESFFYLKNHLYILTKSRTEQQAGKTSLYKVPLSFNKELIEAEFLADYSTCLEQDCRITSADISPDGKKVVLLSKSQFLFFTDFLSDNFFEGKVSEYPILDVTQKESVVFKDSNTLYLTDEVEKSEGGNLYEFTLPVIE